MAACLFSPLATYLRVHFCTSSFLCCILFIRTLSFASNFFHRLLVPSCPLLIFCFFFSFLSLLAHDMWPRNFTTCLLKMHLSLFSFTQTSFKVSINSIMYFLSYLIIPACTRMSSNGIPSRILLTTCWKTSGTVAMPKGTLLKQYVPQMGWRLCFSLCILTLSFAGISSIGMVAKTSWRFVRWFLSVVSQWVMSPDRNPV